jgi:fucose 4-O-acetylase-like acetyltransferase
MEWTIHNSFDKQNMGRVRETAPAPRAPGRTPSQRVEWIDYARGITIVLVVFGHCYRGIFAAGYIPPGGVFEFIDYAIYSFHMPLFFFLSGVFSAGSAANLAQLWRTRLAVLAWPYVLWMTVELCLLALFSDMTNSGSVLIGPDTYLYRPISPFWFLYALLIANLFVFSLRSLAAPWRILLALAVFAAGQFMPLPIIPTTTWGVLYFTGGTACAIWVKQPAFAHAISRGLVLALSGAGIVLLGLTGWQLGLDYLLNFPVAAAGCVFVFGMAVRLVAAARYVPALGFVSYLGRISLTVLVVHIIGTATTRIVLARVFEIEAPWIHLVAGTVAGIALPVLVQAVCGQLGLLKILGLPRLHRATVPTTSQNAATN